MGIWNGPPHEPQYLCGAKAKHSGNPCRQFAMKNGRCYIHGGKSTGAINPHRSIKHGQRTKEAEELRNKVTTLIRQSNELVEK